MLRSFFSALFSILMVLLTFSKFIKPTFRKRSTSTRKNRVGKVSLFQDGIERTKKPPLLHPFLLALFPALSLVSDNATLITINRTVVAIGVITLFINSICFFLLRSIVKNAQKAAAIVSHSLLLFMSYGHVFDFLSLHLEKDKFRHRHLLLTWSVTEIFNVWFITKAARNLDRYTVFLNTLAGTFVIVSFLQIVVNKITQRNKWGVTRNLEDAVTEGKGNNKFHDIYYIIVDGYARSSTLREVYNYDNSQFINKLKEKGFFIADQSRSNYAMTTLSLASSLNLDYINSLSNTIEEDHQSVRPAKRMIETNFSMRYAKSKGYQVIFIGSGFGVTQRNGDSDLDIKCGRIDETLGRFIQSTLLRALVSRTHLLENDKRNRILCMFSQLASVSCIEGPKFVFAHIPSPQWPFLFNSNGSLMSREEFDTEKKKEAYLNQAVFIENKIVDLVEKILAQSRVEPIIILQSDHGPNFAYDGGYEKLHPGKEILQEKMRIFNAYYLPGGETGLFYESITPVNTFRLLYNRYLGSKFPILEDRSYFSTLEYPYQLDDVTGIIKQD